MKSLNQYFCKTCGQISRESTCRVCGGRTELQSDLYWCPDCRIPLYTQQCSLCHRQGNRIASDIRPVFPEERLLIELILGSPCKYAADSVWCGGNYYYVNGKRIAFSRQKAKAFDSGVLRQQLEDWKQENESFRHYFEEYINRFIRGNRQRFEEITGEAQEYILRMTEGKDAGSMFVSFSGGKDSTVVSDLVMCALSNPKILHLYGDTTLEFPFSLDYVNRFQAQHRGTPLMVARNKEKDFAQLCQVIGPPSRVMRWCCTVFKTGAITRKIQVLFKNKPEVISFQGIRRQESASRSKYERESSQSKIARQKVLAPIIDWSDFDVWLYLLTQGLDFNEAYRYGYSRVGCWCCPNNSDWSEFLSSIYMPKQYEAFQKLLIDFAAQIGKPDPENYVRDGKWKARQGGNGLEAASQSVLQYESCVLEEDAVNYELKKPVSEELYELFRPFGYLDFQRGNPRLGEVYILDRQGNGLLRLSGRIGSTRLKVTLLDYRFAGAVSKKAAEEKIRAQLTKYQMCMGCRACESVCKMDAISIREETDGTIHYRIDEKRCIRCGECVSHFIAGCYMRKVLSIRRT